MTIQPSPFLPALLQPHKHADNGFSPDASFYAQITGAMGHVVAYRRKLVYRRAVPLGAAGGITGTPWRWHCRTGVGAQRFVIYALLGLDDRKVAVDPYISVAITRTSVPTTTTMEFHAGASQFQAVDAPEEFCPFATTMDVSPDEVYTGAVTFNDNVRVIALLVWEDASPEVEDAIHPHTTWTPSAGSPIFDDDVENELDGVGDMLRKNGGIRWDWTVLAGTARTRTLATYINLVDNTSGATPTTSTPGVKFHTQYRNTRSATTVPITMAVYGSVVLGSGTVKLRDTSGNDAATVTINGAAGWYTAAGAITVGTGQKYDLVYAGDGSNTVTVNAVSIYEEG